MALDIGKYHQYLKSEHWKKVKTTTYTHRLYRCIFCGTRKGLQIHHITYENIGNEKPYDLVYLCNECHKRASFAPHKTEIQNWLNKRRKKWKKTGKLPDQKKWNPKRKIRRFNKIRGVKKKSAFSLRKNYAGLFTWKANELKQSDKN